jgi:hypothetical protein
VGGTFFPLKRKGLKGVKTKGTKNSLKAGTRGFQCKMMDLSKFNSLIWVCKRLYCSSMYPKKIMRFNLLFRK